MVMLCGRSKLRHAAWEDGNRGKATTTKFPSSNQFSMIKGFFHLTPHLYTAEIILILLLGLSW